MTPVHGPSIQPDEGNKIHPLRMWQVGLGTASTSGSGVVLLLQPSELHSSTPGPVLAPASDWKSENMLAETRDSRKWWRLVVIVGAMLRIGAETVEARGEVRKGIRRDGKRVLVLVDRAHDRGQDTPACSA